MAAFLEGGTAGGTGRESEGNVTLGRLGKAAWDALAAWVEPRRVLPEHRSHLRAQILSSRRTSQVTSATAR